MPSILDASATCSGRTTVMATATRLSMVRASGSLTTTATVTARGEVLLRPAMYAPTLTTAAGETTPTFGIDLYDGDAQPYDATAVDEARLTVTHKPTGATLVDSELMAVTSGSKAARATYSFGEGQAFELERVGGHTATVAVSAAGETQTVPAGGELAIRAGDTPGYQQLSLDGAGLERGLAARESDRTATMAAFDSVDVTTADVGEAMLGESTFSGDVTLDAASLLGDDADLTLDTQPKISGKTSGVDPLHITDAAGTSVLQAHEGGGVDIGDFLKVGGTSTLHGDVTLDAADLLGDDANLSLVTQPQIASTTSGVDPLTVSDAAGTTVFEALEGGNVGVPNGQLSEQGNRVATRTWTDSNYNNYTDADAVNAVESTSLLTLNQLEIGTNLAGSETDLKLNANANIASDTSIYHLVSDGSSGSVQFGFGDTIRSGNETYSLSIQAGGTVNATQGPLQENGNRVATRTWTDSNYNNYTDADAVNAVESTSLLTLNQLEIGTNLASSDTDLKLNANANIASDSSIYHLVGDGSNGGMKFGFGDTIRSGNETYSLSIQAGGTVNATQGPLQENGARVATRTWTNNNADVPNADDATMWDGYERYISSSAPSTSNPYIRFEPK